MSTTIGRNIRSARAERDLTQSQLAALLRCESMLVSKWERGKHSPSDTNLQALAAVLKQPVSWFFTDHDKAAA